MDQKGEQIKTTVHFDAQKVTSNAIATLYERVGFGASRDYLTIDDFRNRFLGGTNIFAAFATTLTGQLAGMARSFSDDTFVTYIAEVCVDPGLQRQGIGSALMKAIVDRFQHTAIFADTFIGCEKTFSDVGITPKPKLIACSRAPGPFGDERA
ncbi:GNAT family N-acetyltransferase [Burkholderia guangdongensis]|uniref:GNAT family N-acetyltransferase n=1 Tax=Burkholderia guangdongensis TaxID=1792500 RepID=UPI0015C6C14F|nr:GNAT family N-acetyltransferase [Burkholderia guangdongensis]